MKSGILFFTLLALHALLVIQDRTGGPFPIPARSLSGIRLTVSLLLVAFIAAWVIRERMTRSRDSGG